MSNNDSLLPLGFESFKKDMQILFSFTTQDLEAVLDELERQGTKFSYSDIAKILKNDREDSVRIGIYCFILYQKSTKINKE